MFGITRYVEAGRFAFPLQAPAAGMLLVVSLVLMVAAGLTFVRAKTTINPLRPERTSSLVTTGVFTWSRNPIYFADLLLLAALALWLGQAFAFALLPLFVVYLNHFQIVPEEETLLRLFGAQYDAYRSRVRRWL